MFDALTFAAERRERVQTVADDMAVLLAEAFNSRDWDEVVEAASQEWMRLSGMTEQEAGDALDTFRSILTDALDATGDTEPDTTERKNQVTRMSLWMGTFIANDATFASLDSQGIGKQWVTMKDDNVRDTHRPLDGTVVPVGDTFTVGGVQMRYPGEPVGDPSLWIACRCVILPAEAVTASGEEEPMDDDLSEEEVAAETAEMEYEPVPWHGVLAPVETVSGDKRMFASGSLTSRDLPLPLTWQRVSAPGHDGSVVVANITEMWEDDGLIKASGFFMDSPEAEEVIGLRANDMLRGVSVDIDEAEIEYVNEEMSAVDIFNLGPEDPMPIERLVRGRICSAAIVPIPAFQEAWFDLGTWDEALSAAAECEDCEDEVDNTDGVIVALIPADGDPVVAASSEPAHVTMAWMGTTGDFAGDPDKIQSDLAEYAASASGPITAEVVKRGLLGDDDADVVFVDGDGLRAYRDGLVALHSVKYAMDNVEQHPEWTPHVTLGYPATPANGEYQGEKITFDRIALWFGDQWTTYALGVDGVAAAGAEAFAPGTKDGPGWITHPKATSRIRRYWVRGKGAAKIRWGAPGDFNRCRRQLAKYVQNPEWLAGLCANMHKEALGIWPGEHHSMEDIVTASASTVTPAPAWRLMDKREDAITAAAARRPKAWFENPNLDGPTRVTITEEGRVFGHVASWNVCHIGMQDRCVTAPKSSSGYAYFHTGAVLTDEGEVPVGHITMDTGHASMSASATVAMAHYDNTGTVIADVACGEDAYGIWFAGAIRPGMDESKVEALRAAALSGDWRRIGSSLEMVAALAVNVPGFPVPRTAIAASGTTDVALVAAAVVSESNNDEEALVYDLVSKAIDAYKKSEKRAAEAQKLRGMFVEAASGEVAKARAAFAEEV